MINFRGTGSPTALGLVAGLILAGPVVVLTAPPALAAPDSFASCAAMNVYFKNGIAESQSARRSASRNGLRVPQSRPKIYDNSSRLLDLDGDGIMCGREAPARQNCTPGYSPCLPPASDYDCRR